MAERNNDNSENSKLVGLMAQFDDPHKLVHACDEARQAGFKRMDAYSPFPVHGIDPAIGIRRTWLPFFVLAIGLGAVLLGLGMQWYANAGDFSPIFPGYNFKISGKPFWSLPANIPVTFEVIVLSSAFATFFGMWILGTRKPGDSLLKWTGLPRFANPLFRIPSFKRVTNDRFFLVIDHDDPQFDRMEIENKFNSWGAMTVEEVRQDLTDTELPNAIKLIPWILIPLLMIPPAMIYRAAGATSRSPRLHFMPDMDWQEKFKTQTVGPDLGTALAPNPLFADGRSMRRGIPGTIARGQLESNIEYHRGIQQGSEITVTGTSPARTALQEGEQEGEQEETGGPDAAAAAAEVAEPNWVTTFPEEVMVDADLLKRGQERFNIYCSACHGYDGNGQGLVNQRAMALNASGQAAWTTAKSLHDPQVKENAVGRIFDTITHGRGTMGPYKNQIPVADRWAIVAYVKALQATGIQPPVTVAPEAPAEDAAE